jgi:hypothetical protein
MVEGREDQAFICSLVEDLSLEGFHVHNMNGKDKWHTYLRTVSELIEFQERVRSICLVKDSDSDPEACWRSCRDGLTRAGLATPSKPWRVSDSKETRRSAVLILPKDQAGELEDLVLRACDSDRLECIDGYFQCLQASPHGTEATAKGRLQVYIGGLNKHVPDLGSAMHAKLIDPNHEDFSDVRDILTRLSGSAPNGD